MVLARDAVAAKGAAAARARNERREIESCKVVIMGALYHSARERKTCREFHEFFYQKGTKSTKIQTDKNLGRSLCFLCLCGEL